MLYLVKKNKVYYLRIRIPKDVRHLFPSSEFKRSLRTPSYKQANALARIFVADAEKVFMMIRSNALTYPQMCKIMEKFTAKKLVAFDAISIAEQKEHGYDKTKESILVATEKNIREGKDNLAKNSCADVYHKAAQRILEENSITVDKDSPEFNQFCIEYVKACILQREVMQSRIVGEEHPYELELKKMKKSNTLEEVVKAYIVSRNKTSQPRTLAKLEEKFSKILECFEFETGDKEVLLSSIDYPLTRKVAERLAKYPLYRRTKYGGKSLAEIYELKDVRYPSYTTVDEEISMLSSLYKFSSSNFVGLEKNFAENLSQSILGKSKTKDSEYRDIFRPEDIQEILDGLLKVKMTFHLDPHRYLIPLIGLYSGMRVNEICQLYLDDIKEVGGIWCFDNNEDESGKSLKNANSKRTNPIHPDLIKIGLLSYHDLQKNKGYTRLWEGVRHNSCDYYKQHGSHSHYFDKWFNGTFKKHLKLSNATKQSFHSFRHTFLDWYNQNVDIRVHWHAITALSGHLDEDDMKLFGIDPNSIARKRYSKELNVKKQYETLKLLDFGIDIKNLKIEF